MARGEKLFQIVKKINLVLGQISGVGVICLCCVSFFEVISRKVFNYPTTWTFDVSKYLFLFVSFLAFTYTMQKDGHINFTFLVERTKHMRAFSKILALISGIFGVTFCFFFFYETVVLDVLAIKLKWITRGLATIPIFYLYTIMCVGSLMLLITFLVKAIRSLSDSGGGDSSISNTS